MAKYKGYPDNWDRLRHYVYGRDGYRCQMCGQSYDKRHLHCHHIRPLGIGGSNNAGNLITLCDQCHKEVHEKKLYHIPDQIAKENGYK